MRGDALRYDSTNDTTMYSLGLPLTRRHGSDTIAKPYRLRRVICVLRTTNPISGYSAVNLPRSAQYTGSFAGTALKKSSSSVEI